MADPTLIAGALGIGAVLFAALHVLLRTREHWLIALLITALVYIVVSMVPGQHLRGFWLPAFRWGLFVLTLAAFVRFRWHHRFRR